MTTSQFLEFLKNVSPILSGAAQGSANGLAIEGNLAAQQNQGATSRYQAMVNAGRLQNIEQPNANLDQATRGSVLSSWQPVVVGQSSVPYGSTTNGPVRSGITGGPQVTPELRQLGSQVTRDALARQLGGNQNTSTFPSDAELGMTPAPKASTLDKILGYAATGSSLLGSLPKGMFGGGGASGVSAVGANGIPQGGTMLAPETMPGAGGGGLTVPMGGGPSVPSSQSWFTPLDNAKLQQNNPGSAQSYLPNPFSDYGSSGVPDTLTWILQNGSRSYKR